MVAHYVSHPFKWVCVPLQPLGPLTVLGHLPSTYQVNLFLPSRSSGKVKHFPVHVPGLLLFLSPELPLSNRKLGSVVSVFAFRNLWKGVPLCPLYPNVLGATIDIIYIFLWFFPVSLGSLKIPNSSPDFPPAGPAIAPAPQAPQKKFYAFVVFFSL